jgi:hypothetical protein
MYFQGGASNNRITMGRNIIWGTVGNVDINETVTLLGNTLIFPGTLKQYKINIWGTNAYGFGIAASTTQYSSQSNHSFYNSSTNIGIPQPVKSTSQSTSGDVTRLLSRKKKETGNVT